MSPDHLSSDPPDTWYEGMEPVRDCQCRACKHAVSLGTPYRAGVWTARTETDEEERPPSKQRNDPKAEKMRAGDLQHNIPVVHIDYAWELWAEIERLSRLWELAKPNLDLLADTQRSEARLRAALTSLANEVDGMMSLANHPMRFAAGNTNVECLLNRLHEAREALGAAHETPAVRPDAGPPIQRLHKRGCPQDRSHINLATDFCNCRPSEDKTS